ncbi:hypothetical protein H2248_004714 [Termitomyces sp. 'cryptogamus']|nr:hypothetical protein H2248_004714 [Termitomyces sp. 'cryptogamus']
MYIAVHGGAGIHSYTREKEIKHALRSACREGLKNHGPSDSSNQISFNSTPLDVVSDAIAVLEDDPHLNAGYGSNLTLNGTVECDAAIMDGHSTFGSVGAVSGVKNPIRLARAILDYSKVPDSLGRIPPLTLVSEGAHSFAVSENTRHEQEQATNAIETVPPESMISPKAKDEWTKWKARLDHISSDIDMSDPTSLTDIQDTVGAVAYRIGDTVAAGVSSGGILLKHPGRLGEAAIFGAGCWAQNFPGSGTQIACSISGAGEHVVRSMLAREIGNCFSLAIVPGGDIDAHDILHTVVLEKFWIPCRERGVVAPDVGILLLLVEQIEGKPSGMYFQSIVHDTYNTQARLWCAFTTPSMAIAYASSSRSKPAVIQRYP